MPRWIKLHSTLTISSIWREPLATRVVWLSLMSLCDMDGIAHISDDRIAAAANVSEDEAKAALKSLMSPDPHSKDPEFDGRRLQKVSGGFRLLNYFKYRNIQPPMDKKAYMRDYMKDYRKKKREKREAMTWQEVYQNEAADAQTLPIPAHFPPEVEAAMIDFISSRVEKATVPVRKQDRLRFSPAMLRALFNETEVALITSTPTAVASRLRESAIKGTASPKFKGFYDC